MSKNNLNNKSLKISTLSALFIASISIIILFGLTGAAYNISKEAVKTALKTSFKQKFQSARQTYQSYEIRALITLDHIANNENLLDAFKERSPNKVQKIFNGIQTRENDVTFDILFAETLEGNFSVDESSPYYPGPSITASAIEDLKRNGTNKDLLIITHQTTKYYLLFFKTELISLDDKQVLGNIYGGIILNDALELLEEIRSFSATKEASILVNNDLALTTNISNSKIYSTLKAASNLKENKFEIKKDLVYQTDIISSFQSNNLQATLLDDYKYYISLRNKYISDGTIWISIILIITIISFIIFNIFVSNDTKNLLLYIKKGPASSTEEFNPGKIREFNIIGLSMQVMREKVEESEAKFKGIFNKTFQLMGILTCDGTLIAANQTSLDFVGCNEEEVLNKKFWDTPWWSGDTESQKKLKEGVVKASSGEFIRFETKHKSKNGSYTYVDFSLKPVTDKTGKVNFIIPEGRDITTLKLAEIELERHRNQLETIVRERTNELSSALEKLEQFQQVIHSSSEAIAIVDENGNSQYSNSGFTNLFGAPLDERFTLKDIFTSKEQYESLLARICLGNGCNERITLQTKDKTKLTVLFKADFSKIEDIKHRKIIIVITDITRLEAMELKLIKAETERLSAINANLSKSTFLANMSHELRTPLHCITSFSTLALKRVQKNDYEKVESHLNHVVSCADELFKLVENLLLLSSLEAGKVKYAFHNHSLNLLVESSLDEFNDTISKKEISFDLSLSSGKCTATLCSQNIQNVIRSLLKNATEYSDPGTTIEIKTQEDTQYVYLEITNRGVPIPPTELATIFNNFEQSSNTKSGAGGKGIGLAICKKIIEDHSGKIWAKSSENGVTVFTFKIPKNIEA